MQDNKLSQAYASILEILQSFELSEKLLLTSNIIFNLSLHCKQLDLLHNNVDVTIDQVSDFNEVSNKLEHIENNFQYTSLLAGHMLLKLRKDLKSL